MKYPIISLLLPTRGRPNLVNRLFKSISVNTTHLEQIEIILYVDEDDVGSHHLGSEEVSVKRIIGPRTSMGAYNSACYAAAQGDIIILVNDDMIIGTQGWDTKIIDLHTSISDKIYLAYGNDLFKKGNLCTFPILSRRTCELLVEPYPKEYQGAFIDYHLLDIFKRLQHAEFDRIHYLEDIVFEHLHYRTGKAPFDETYGKRGRFADDSTFLALIESRKKAAEQLLSVLRGDEIQTLYSPERGAIERIPETLVKAIAEFTRDLLFNHSLPLRWRSYLWVWFIGRYMAGRGMLWPFVR
ncbi:MAG: hypothetical protein H8D34_31630 [Chloroflexi bacterium]|nr:hypothetical protein [Chloroflexota bacterium]